MASGLAALLTDKPKVPKLERVDFGKEQLGAIEDNLAALPQLSALADKTNQISTTQLNSALERMLPGYAAMRDKVTGNINSQLRGEIPKDVENLIERRAAERGVTLGTSGSDYDQFSSLRNLGISSLQLQQQGLDSASRWLDAVASKTPVFNVSSMFITPQQRIATRERENQFNWQRNWLKNQISAVPWGWQAAVINIADNIQAVGHSIVSSYAGGAAGGMGGGGGGGSSGSSPAVSSASAWQSVAQQPVYSSGMSLNGGGSAWGSPYGG